MKNKKIDSLLDENYRLAKALSAAQETSRVLNKSNAVLVQERNKNFVANSCLTHFFQSSMILLDNFKDLLIDKENYILEINKIFNKCTQFLCNEEDEIKILKSDLVLSDITNLSFSEKNIEKSRKSPPQNLRVQRRPTKLVNYSELSPKQSVFPKGKSSLEVYDFPAEEEILSPSAGLCKKRAVVYRSSDNSNNLGKNSELSPIQSSFSRRKSSLAVKNLDENSPPILNSHKTRKKSFNISIESNESHTLDKENENVENLPKTAHDLDMHFTDMSISDDSIHSIRYSNLQKQESIMEECPELVKQESIINFSINLDDSQKNTDFDETIKMNEMLDISESKEKPTGKKSLITEEVKHDISLPQENTSLLNCTDKTSTGLLDLETSANEIGGRKRRSRNIVSYKPPSIRSKLRKGDTEWCRK